jgi:hypothetical protein
VKLTLKLILILSLFSSVAFAEDGTMGAGGRACPQGQTTCRSAEQPAETTDNDSILIIIQQYLTSIFG